MSRKAIAVAAVAAVLTVSACSSEKTADIDGATLMSKVSSKLSSNTQKGDKIDLHEGRRPHRFHRLRGQGALVQWD